jgi:hypothetical protein
MKTKQIKTGVFVGNYPVSKLKHSLVNRDIVSNHFQQFGKKIEQYGWLSPIIIDEKGNIIEGHHRAMAAEKLNLDIIPVYIVDWVNTSNLNEYQKYIISLNSSNRPWGAIDYLKSFSRNKVDYKYVNTKYNETKDVFSVGNVLNIYFDSGSNQRFKDGLSTIKNKDFSEFLFENFLRLKRTYGGVKFQAFTINRVCSFAHQKIKDNKKEMTFLFSQLEMLAETGSPLLSSVEMIRPWLNKQLKMQREINKK